MRVNIPGTGELTLAHLVLDYNGTLAVDGSLLPAVPERIEALSTKLTVHVVTADTFGSVRNAVEKLPLKLTVLPPGAQDRTKADMVAALGAAHCCAVGNGRNDRLMLQVAALGIAVVQGEGAAAATLAAADVITNDIATALDLLLFPTRLQATLRV